MVAWNLAEAKFVQERLAISAANDESLTAGYSVPQGKCWVIIGFAYRPSVGETQVISMAKVTAGGNAYSVLNPVSLALSSTIVATFIEQGMEYLLLPGETLRVVRGSHTVGSTMSFLAQIIEIDLPLYTYDEPQVVKRQDRALSSVRARLGAGVTGGRGGVGPATGPVRGGRSGPLPQ